MKLGKTLMAVAVAAMVQQAAAAPIDEAPDVQFSARIYDNFYLLKDGYDSSKIYYIPKRGNVAIQAATSSMPIPRFNVFHKMQTSGFFAGETLSYMGGSFSTLGDYDALQDLLDEANRYGLKAFPAPATEAQTTFLATGNQIDNGRLDIACSNEKLTIGQGGQQRQIQVPKCTMLNDESSEYDLSTNVMYRFRSMMVPSQSVVNQDLPFQAVTTPGWDQQINNILMTGGQWDNLLTARIDWKIKTDEKYHVVKVKVDWNKLFDQASQFTSQNQNANQEQEVQQFFQQQAQCQDVSQCGAVVQFQQNDGSFSPVSTDDDRYQQAVGALRDKLQGELFNEVAAFQQQQQPSPNPGQQQQQWDPIYTMKSNYDKLMKGSEEFMYYYTPGVMRHYNTTLNFSCMKQPPMSRIVWNMDDPGCRALIDQ
ncbi:hypothetical protein H0A36_06230 [Endozoicomonas sp. SM1973]|uniref:Uncharacterized protein n=1 Tax=Spartinivicinus marinus TaxID=2994442 RepID=A0A853HWH4_9GAMM|nr:hypothetical protein [Spartinivicinus marinus]MCX4028268.1 hypothetical protein [Spartinivicinus marinus]NYZ65603.1 hypothetical protein [Spartinivicinus marinus]